MCVAKGCGHGQELRPMAVDPEHRRLFLQGLACLPLSTVLAFPELCRAAARALDTVTMNVNGAAVAAALALPEAEKAPAMLLIHEWWGLNDQIKSVAAELTNMGYVALAVDLYAGAATTTGAGARALMGKVDQHSAKQTLLGWHQWLREHERAAGKIGTVGWCFGGGWSL